MICDCFLIVVLCHVRILFSYCLAEDTAVYSISSKRPLGGTSGTQGAEVCDAGFQTFVSCSGMSGFHL